MNHETVSVPNFEAEAIAIPPQYEFMSSDSISELRRQQLEEEIKARSESLASRELLTNPHAAEARLLANVDTDAHNYVAEHMNRDDNPELFDTFKDLVATVSYQRATPQEWYLGDKDDEGNYSRPETSLRSRYENALRDIFGSVTREMPVLTPLPKEEDVLAAQEALTNSRSQLAALSVERRRLARNGGKKAKNLEREYTEAQQIYEQARIALGSLEAQRWAHENLDPQEIRKNVVKYILDEHQSFTRAEAEVLAEDQTRMNKVAKFLARHNWRFMLGSGAVSVAAGVGINMATETISKTALVGALGLAGAVALPASVTAGVAIKTTKAVLQTKLGTRVHQHLHHDKRAEQDHTSLKDHLHELLGNDESGHSLITIANHALSKIMDKRVGKDITSNRNRIIGAVALSGAAGALGFLASADLSGGWPFEHHAHAISGHHGIGSGNHDSAIQKPPVQNTPPVTAHDHLPHHKPGVIDGYQSHVHIQEGEGYEQALTNLASQKHIKLTGTQSWDLYEHLNNVFHGNFLTNDPSYHMNNVGEWGISRAGAAHWNPAVIHEMNHWMNEHDLSVKASKAAKKLASSRS